MRPLLNYQKLVASAFALSTAGCASAATHGNGGPRFENDWHRQLHAEFGRQPDTIPSRWKGLIGEYGPDTTLRWFVLERDQRLHVLDQHGNFIPLAARNDSIYDAPRAPLPVSGEVRFQRDATGRAWGVRVADMVMARRNIEPPPGATQLLITPVRPIDELRREAIAATPPAERGSFKRPDLVEITTLDNTIKLEVRYATSNNFIGTPVYSQARAFLQRPAAEALARANAALRPLGYGLLVHDAYRPWYVTKIFWDATPSDKKWLVANPAEGSKHNRGAAVDVTLYTIANGRPVEMPSTYDETTDRAKSDYPGGTSLQRYHRALLRRALEHEGFTVNPTEWWHFDYEDWRSYPILNVPFESLLGSNGSVSGSPSLAQRAVAVDTLRWMSGCWTLSRGTRVTDEMWMIPRGGVMLGVARTVDAGQARDTEFTRIFATHDTLVYEANPSNQAVTQFRSKRLAPGEVVFENLAHDFPKRIGYRAVVPDSLHAYIEGSAEGERRIWYRYVRAACS